MEFTFCGQSGMCYVLEQQRKAGQLPGNVGQLLKEHECFNCLDQENSANLIANIQREQQWRTTVRARCDSK